MTAESAARQHALNNFKLKAAEQPLLLENGEITVGGASYYTLILPQGKSSEKLLTINGGEIGTMLHLDVAVGDTVIIDTDDAGSENIFLSTNYSQPYIMTYRDCITFLKKSLGWYEMYRNTVRPTPKLTITNDILYGNSDENTSRDDSVNLLNNVTTESDGAVTFAYGGQTITDEEAAAYPVMFDDVRTINVSVAATGNFKANSASFILSKSPRNPQLTNFPDLNKTFPEVKTFTITPPTTHSSGEFTYTSSDTGVATISGNTVTLVGPGPTTITANQAQTINYIRGTITATLNVSFPRPTILSAFKSNSGYVPVDLTWTYVLYDQANYRYFWVLHHIGDGSPWREAVQITNISTDAAGIMTASFIVGEYIGVGDSIKIFAKNQADESSPDSNVMLLDVGLDALGLDGGLLYPERIYRTGASSSGSINNDALFQISSDNGVTYSEPEGMLYDDNDTGNDWVKWYKTPQLDIGTTYKIRAHYTQRGKTSPYTYANFTVTNQTTTNHPTGTSDYDGFIFKILNDRFRTLKTSINFETLFHRRAWDFKQFIIKRANSDGTNHSSNWYAIYDLATYATNTWPTWIGLVPGDFYKLEQTGGHVANQIKNSNYYALWQVPNDLDTGYGGITLTSITKSDHNSYLIEFNYSSNYLLEEIRIIFEDVNINVNDYSATDPYYTLRNNTVKGINVIDTAIFNVNIYSQTNNTGIKNVRMWQNSPNYIMSNTLSYDTSS